MPSIRRRLLTTLIAAFALIWVGVAAFTYLTVQRQVEERFDRQLAQTAEVLWLLFASAQSDGLPAPDDLYAGRVIQRFGVNHAFQVWDGRELIGRSPNAPEQPMAPGYGVSTGTLHDREWRFYYRVDALRGLDVIVANALSERRSLVASLVVGTVWPLLAALPVLALLIVLGVQQGLRPLQQIARNIGERRADSLSPVSGQRTPQEIAPLVQALNDLLARLQEAMDRERRFTASASHELRTPLAALKTEAQLARRTESREERQRSLDAVIAGVDRATHLLEQLLALARLDPDAYPEPPGEVDLKALAEEVMAELEGAARRRQVELVLVAKPARMEGRSGALALLLRNLLDNAIRYSPDGGVVEVMVETPPGGVRLTVRDQGPGIPAEERQRVFGRFYRRLGSVAGGSGLGLSIVARVAEVHGAEVGLSEVGPPAGGASAGAGPGLLVTVWFPRPPDPGMPS